ncbi:hypothetical protein CEXT_327981 [Caerostris extrusa]|uniref:Uncharacterized protein n=1 Tax=Caerostris extrusa TaxID=172846 RepID=A0AAV4SZ72_CAEEX|nr:hypothetical protein CEXT_327981 [Caerostris extrusa]
MTRGSSASLPSCFEIINDFLNVAHKSLAQRNSSNELATTAVFLGGDCSQDHHNRSLASEQDPLFFSDPADFHFADSNHECLPLRTTAINCACAQETLFSRGL